LGQKITGGGRKRHSLKNLENEGANKGGGRGMRVGCPADPLYHGEDGRRSVSLKASLLSRAGTTGDFRATLITFEERKKLIFKEKRKEGGLFGPVRNREF